MISQSKIFAEVCKTYKTVTKINLEIEKVVENSGIKIREKNEIPSLKNAVKVQSRNKISPVKTMNDSMMRAFDQKLNNMQVNDFYYKVESGSSLDECEYPEVISHNES